ncbi:MAG: hypothetical protein WCA21_07735 [Terracidiphilus sp.]|jgi:hypothetical protein
MSAAGALAVAVALAGCGGTTYFAGRTLPPSGLTNRVLIAIQNPSTISSGTLEIVDAYYDIRFKYNSTNVGPAFSVSGVSVKLPISIQNMPDEGIGAIYSYGSGSFSLVNYAKEASAGSVNNLNGLLSSVFITRNQSYAFAASQSQHVLTVVNQANGGSYPLSLPGVYGVSVNPGGSVALAFVQNSNSIYYPRQLTAAQTIAYSGGPTTWPKAAVDCEPQSGPGWCLFQAQSPDHVDATGNYYGTPLTFDRPIKAVFSADGSTAYILNCGPECGGTTASISTLPIAPMNFLVGQQSGLLPTQSAINATTLLTPGGASNARVAGSILYVVGQQKMPDGYFGGHLTVIDLSKNSISTPAVSISDGAPGATSRMLMADDNTMWIGMTHCNTGERANNGQPFGCLTMVNTSTNAVTVLPYIGNATGIAAVTGLHKVYTAENGQVYIHSTLDGSLLDNQYVTVTGTAYDVAYMDAYTDDNNTVY